MCFVQEVDYYMNRQELEQHRKLTGVMPTVAMYWETRLGTSAVTSMLALNECVAYSMCIQLKYILTDMPLDMLANKPSPGRL
jgi:hypothetical protein